MGLPILLVLVGCATAGATDPGSPTRLVAPSGEIMRPPCPASAACLGGFVVGDTLYGISCHGVEPTAVEDEAIATGDATFAEVRAIRGVPTDLWMAVRGDLPCLPREGEPLAYDWYLAIGELTEADLEEWGARVADITLPIDPRSSSDREQ